MKINVVKTDPKPWVPPGGGDALYSIQVEGQGEIKTFEAKFNELGEHEAESFQAKSGKTYWRIPKAPSRQFNTKKSYEADPAKIASIEWQKAVAEGNILVKNWYDVALMGGRESVEVPDMEHYKLEVVNAAITLASAIDKKPDDFIDDPDEAELDMLEIADDTSEDDLPPTELYEDLA